MSRRDTPSSHYDIIIVGLGPAGATLARLLGPHLRVLAIDKKTDDEDRSFKKPCGGLLAPDAQNVLARFGLTLPSHVLVSPQIFAVKTIDTDTRQTRYYQRFYLNLDRHRFDQWLVGLIPARVEVRKGASFKSLVKNEAGYRVTFHQGGVDFKADATHVVGADGASSAVRSALYGARQNIRHYVAIQQWFRDEHAEPFYSCIFDPDTTDCYAWGLSKNEHFIFGGAFPQKRCRERFEQLKERAKQFGFHFGEPLKTEACMVLRPSGLFDCRAGKNGGFLIGEAAGFISPSSLEGISHAMGSALTLSKILNEKKRAPNRSYFLRTLPIRVRLFLKNVKIPFMYFKPLRWLVMATGIRSIDMAVAQKNNNHITSKSP
ncbi:FAD-binding protein [Ereboglobus luteus]|uniref:Colicin M resistance protein CbrA n=1 Tax=Ereboglobus luteus TaxID=1796921 RepID=A0A2U8E6N1_9BACT|nr:FAD-binding protein [Ereboglobus luteus]AWI10192.1 colicin M resistance protein CbrA [Ereboglobus luteus]